MGKLIVIDGLDGQGKATQTELLVKYLKSNGYSKVYKVSFPDYQSESSAAVKMYLSGELGNDPEKLNPYMCSSFYAVDRAIQCVKYINNLLADEDAIIIADRYLSANIIHQGAKIRDIEKRHKFYKWDYEYETCLLGIPKEDITIILSVPVQISQKLILARYSGDDTKRDIHESDIKYLNDCYEQANDAYEYLSSIGYNWSLIHCETDDKSNIKSIEDIHNSIVNKLKELKIIE